jgi:hypothetical protein
MAPLISPESTAMSNRASSSSSGVPRRLMRPENRSTNAVDVLATFAFRGRRPLTLELLFAEMFCMMMYQPVRV